MMYDISSSALRSDSPAKMRMKHGPGSSVPTYIGYLTETISDFINCRKLSQITYLLLCPIVLNVTNGSQ